ncbi:MAG: DUF5615 family PIN-like protein [Planctomycetota bacterium]
MTIRLYLDEDAMDGHLVDALRSRGVDIETAYEAGMIEREDDEQLEYATAQGRTLYGFNMGHFCQLHAEVLTAGITHAGIVLCRQKRYPVGEQMRRLVRLISTLSAEEMNDRLEFLSNWG